jgi:uncharacterized protein YlaI
MRSDYLPATAVCFGCGHLIHEDQINGCVEGTITHIDDSEFMTKVIVIDPFTGYLCKECKIKFKERIEGGIPAATKRARRREKDEDAELGKQDPSHRKKD